MIFKWFENICVFWLILLLLGFVAYIHNKRNGNFRLGIREKKDCLFFSIKVHGISKGFADSMLRGPELEVSNIWNV